MSARDPVPADHWTMMRAAELECHRERRPVSVLKVRKYRPAGSGDVSWLWLDERAEHLAVRRDATI